jgi:transposase
MAKNNHFFSVIVYTITIMNNTYYNEYFEIGQQKINLNLYQIGLPADDPVYTLKKVMEELDFSGLTSRYLTKGRKGYNPIMMFTIILYANMRGVKAVDRIVELCERDIAFLWLSKGEKPRQDAFYDFINNKLTNEIQEDLHYQFIRRIQKEGFVTLKNLFIDGTKIEANANRYTFVWRGNINYHLAGLLDTIDRLYSRYNEIIVESDYDKKYEIVRSKNVCN